MVRSRPARRSRPPWPSGGAAGGPSPPSRPNGDRRGGRGPRAAGGFVGPAGRGARGARRRARRHRRSGADGADEQLGVAGAAVGPRRRSDPPSPRRAHERPAGAGARSEVARPARPRPPSGRRSATSSRAASWGDPASTMARSTSGPPGPIRRGDAQAMTHDRSADTGITATQASGRKVHSYASPARPDHCARGQRAGVPAHP